MYIVLLNGNEPVFKHRTYDGDGGIVCNKAEARKLQEFMSKNFPQTYTIYKITEVK